MKRIVLSVFAIIVAFVAVPAFASVQPEGKDECVLYGKNCPNAVDSLPERVAKLKREIGKGENVYTPEELKQLERKLKEANDMLRIMKKR